MDNDTRCDAFDGAELPAVSSPRQAPRGRPHIHGAAAVLRRVDTVAGAPVCVCLPCLKMLFWGLRCFNLLSSAAIFPDLLGAADRADVTGAVAVPKYGAEATPPTFS